MLTHFQSRLLYKDGDRSFSDTISVCPNNDIAIHVGQLTIARSIKEWHSLAEQQMRVERMSGWRKWLIKFISQQ